MRHLRYLRGNVIYFTCCTTIFFPVSIPVIPVFPAIFCKKKKYHKILHKNCGSDIFRYLEKLAINLVWYIPQFQLLMTDMNSTLGSVVPLAVFL